MAIELLTPVFPTDPASPNFFDGRLLSADDLRAEQKVQRLANRHLGRAFGPGVVEGLEVEQQPRGQVEDGTTAVHIRAGLAINGKGQVLELRDDVDLALVRPSKDILPSPGIFVDCAPPSSDQLLSGSGFYVLVATAAERLSPEQAPKHRQGFGEPSFGCGSRHVLEGVQFRLIEVRLEEFAESFPNTVADLRQLLTAEDAVRRSRRLNLAAHLFFGTEALLDFATAPFGRNVNPFANFSNAFFSLDFSFSGTSSAAPLTAFEILRAAGRLSEADVPLALLDWTADGLADVDLWSVRRPPLPQPPSSRWPTLTGEAALVRAEAVFLQFQAHLDRLLKRGVRADSLIAREAFRYLPSAGFLPLTRGFLPLTLGTTTERFFRGTPTRLPATLIEGQTVASLIRQSHALPPIDLERREFLWLYRPWQNTFDLDADPYLLFTSPSLRLETTANYDLARYDAANYPSPGDFNL